LQRKKKKIEEMGWEPQRKNGERALRIDLRKKKKKKEKKRKKRKDLLQIIVLEEKTTKSELGHTHQREPDRANKKERTGGKKNALCVPFLRARNAKRNTGARPKKKKKATSGETEGKRATTLSL